MMRPDSFQHEVEAVLAPEAGPLQYGMKPVYAPEPLW